MRVSFRTLAARILPALFIGFTIGSVAATSASNTASAAELMDVLFVASEEDVENAPSPSKVASPYAEQAAETAGDEQSGVISTDDPIAENLSAEERLDQLQQEIAKMQEQLALKQDKPAPSKKFQSKIGGLLIMDAIVVDQSDSNRAMYADVPNMFPIREARLGVKGTGYDYINYEATFAFQTNDSQRSTGALFKNILIGVKDVPFFQNVKVGHFKVETSMSERDFLINSSTISYFSGNTMSFSPHRRFGVGSTRLYADKKLRIYNGIYSGRGFNDGACVLDDAPGFILDARVTMVPFSCEDACGNLREILHLGGSAYWFFPGQTNMLRMRARPTSWTGGMQYLLNSAIPLEKGYNVCEGEAAWQRGQFGIISETFVANIRNNGTSWGSTLATRYFLRPGNYRTYSYDGGGFAAPHLVSNFGKSENNTGVMPDTFGELELVGAYAYTNMDNLKNVPAAVYGELHEAIFGVNWWWSPELRWSAAYTQAYVNSGELGGSKKKSSNNTFDIQMSMQF